MIKTIGASDPRFKTVTFNDGLNFVVAQRTAESTDRQSTNGTGKSSLVEIIHFCLGAELSKLTTLRKKPLNAWSFFMIFTVRDRTLEVRRAVNAPKRVLVRGLNEGERTLYSSAKQNPLDPDAVELQIDHWNDLLGALFFDNPPLSNEGAPTFRSLFRYFCRYGQPAFFKPESTFPRESDVAAAKAWSYLLGLNWRLLDDRVELEERVEKFEQDRRGFRSLAVQHEIVANTDSKIYSELFAAKTLAERDFADADHTLKQFRVLPEYEAEQAEADRLTAIAQDARKEIFAKTALIHDYEGSMVVVADVDPKEVVALYEYARIELPSLIVKRLEQVEEFHKQLLRDRRQELATTRRKIRFHEPTGMMMSPVPPLVGPPLGF